MLSKSRYEAYSTALIYVEDFIILNLLYVVLYRCFAFTSHSLFPPLLLFINLGYLFAAIIIRIRKNFNRVKVRTILQFCLYRMFITFFISILVLFSVKISDEVSRIFIYAYFALAFTLLFIAHWITRNFLRRKLRKDKNIEKAVIIGTDFLGRKIFNELKDNSFLGIQPLGFFGDKPKDAGNIEWLGSLQEAKAYILANQITKVFCSLPHTEKDIILDFIDFSEQNVIHFYIIPQIGHYIKTPVGLKILGSMPVFSIRKMPLSNINNEWIKRIFDIVFSFVFLVTLFPVILLVLGIAIKLSSPGPIFFIQNRTGKNGKLFRCYKFRSMKINDEADNTQATANDPRTTRIGRFIRHTNLDELPQFINVFKNDISIVGPRPHPEYLTDKYAQLINKYMVRHYIKPGITGWAQINGYRGETKTVEEMENRIKMDIWYLENWSFWLDIEIIVKTVFKTFQGDNKAY
ncbi:undecaprenyl-phosphate glucose phosphotransferase [Bacteroidia bacterium]|nr:undecaprenyl-phosphate glucose phosphotransferase [Bacteroidia bacterium]GHT26577.1 undecaprenyl-phosphate glucose phosphotransferase [Bacteroidia bacterium]